MPVTPTEIDGLFVVSSPTHGDDRGFFRQSYVKSELVDALGRDPGFMQANHARSQAGVLRGFHAEPWDKMVYVVRGTAQCVIADIRPTSPTFGRAMSFLLGDAEDATRDRLWVSNGLANSYLVVDGPCDYVYDVTAEWTPDADKRAVAWNDETLGVDWLLDRAGVDSPSLSDADMANPKLGSPART